MHAYLLISDNEELVDIEVKKIAKTKNSTIFEYSILKIEDVRELGKILSRTLPENTLILLKNIDNATQESLNAFLKNLEEPQKNVIFILTARNEHKVLPTILSRCQLIKIRQRSWLLNTKKTTNDYIVGIRNGDKETFEFLKMSVGQKLAVTEKIKKRDEAQRFLANLIYNLHRGLIKNASKTDSDLITETQKTQDALNANGNPLIQLANLVVRLGKIV